MDRLDAMATLVEVVAERSFAAAGRRRGLPRAVISKHVSFLESEFGARFFHRTTRRLSLTDAGARFHAHCLAILAAVRAAEQELDERRAAPRGLVRMTAPAAFAELHLMEHLDRFIATYPEVSLDLRLQRALRGPRSRGVRRRRPDLHVAAGGARRQEARALERPRMRLTRVPRGARPPAASRRPPTARLHRLRPPVERRCLGLRREGLTGDRQDRVSSPDERQSLSPPPRAPRSRTRATPPVLRRG